MSIKRIFEKFEQNVHELSFYSNTVDNSYHKYLLDIEEQKNNNHQKLDLYSASRPVYIDIRKNHEILFSDLLIKKTIDEINDDVFYHHNRQMQWFLVEAYELYEKFIEELYVMIGYLDNNFWDVTDFGEIQFSEIKNHDKQWFDKQIKKKKERPYSMLKIFEKRFNLNQYFNPKEPTQNYQFLMNLIAEFRNAIVHNHGYLNKNILEKKLCKGINGKSLVEKYQLFINIFFGKKEHGGLLCLTKIVNNDSVLHEYYDRRIILTKCILSYSHLLTQLSIEFLEKRD